MSGFVFCSIIVGMKNVIYIITNKLNGKSYIGSSINFRERRAEHRRTLKQNKHHNAHLQNAYNKYGSENFIFEIVDQVDDPEKLIACEQWWIDSFDFDNLYNILPTAGSTLGFTLSEETKSQMSKNRRGKGNAFYGKRHSKKARERISISRTGEKHPNYGKNLPKITRQRQSKARKDKKPVAQIDPVTNEVVAFFESVSAAARAFGTSPSSISVVCNKTPRYDKRDGKWYTRKTTRGFIWKFVSDLKLPK